MITCQNGLFHIKTAYYSYLFRIRGDGLPEHLHFGAPVSDSDAGALAAKPGLGWGGSLLLDPADMASGPDFLPLEWSGGGRGDYRESPIELLCGQQALAPAFRFVSHRILAGGLPMQELPQPHGAGQTLELVLEGGGLRLFLYWTAFETALTRRAVLENRSGRPVQIAKLMSFCLDLPGGYRMTTLDGGWIAETHPHTVPVTASRVVNESTAGFSSARHNPGFLLSAPQTTEDAGRVYGFNLVYSGNHYASAQQSLQGLTRVMQGISPAGFLCELADGARFETPAAVLCTSENGFNGLSACMHDFVNEHIVPPYWRGRERPVLFNSWEGCGFSFTQGRLLSLARQAAALGCELFVLDDGWFGARSSDRAGLGDYNVNRRKLPGGLKGLARRIGGMGLRFGLWFEPESVNPDSDLYRAHPDWALTDGDTPPLLGRNQLLLDLTRPDVRNYIVSSVSSVLDSAPIGYVKWDMNRYSPAQGVRAHAYILGLYEVLRRIFGPRPHILLEGCASGGGRFDLGMLCYTPQIWCSDNTDPIERLEIQNGLSYLYPLSTMGAHVSAAPHAQTLRTTPLSTRGNVSCFGLLGYELDLSELLPAEKAELRAQIAFYKKHRRTFQFGRFRRNPAGEGTAWQVSDGGTHLAGLFHRLVPAAPGYERLFVPGLPAGRRYRVESRAQSLHVRQFGGLIKHISPVRFKPDGLVLRTADRHYRMMDGQQSFSASGAALAAGVMLSPRFSGTGYDAALRMQGDFGSNIYEITEIHEEEPTQ